MNEQIKEFLSSHKICVFSTLLKDGSIHSAALHYSHSNEPFKLYFSTDRNSRKCEALEGEAQTKASVVVGFSEEEWITLQMDGEVQTITDPSELAHVQEIHYTKMPGSAKFKDDPDTLFLKFTPHWYRYTDFNTKPVTKISSES